MSKARRYGFPKKRPSKKPGEPTTADDFEQLAEEHEETAKKWRAGDAAKGARGFLRAIDAYNAGLSKYPTNFDLAYNRAQIYAEIAQETRFIPYLPCRYVEFLQLTIEANRSALKLEPGNPDVLFNTAQSLNGLAEELIDQQNAKTGAIRLLTESLDLYTICLHQQIELVNQARQAERETQADSGKGYHRQADEDMEMDIDQASSGDVAPKNQVQTEVSATVIDPTTEDDIIDTALAKLSTLTLLCTLHDPSSDADPSIEPRLEPLEASASELTNTGILSLQISVDDPSASTLHNRATEIHLARAAFTTAFTSAQYRQGLIDPSTFSTRIHSTYSSIPSPSTTSGEVLCAQADALTDLSSTLGQPIPSPSPSSYSAAANGIPSLRWRALTRAQELLASAAALPNAGEDPMRQARLYENKAEVELLRLRLVSSPERQQQQQQQPGGSSPAERRKTATTLAQNAATFYRGAVKWLKAGETRGGAAVRERAEEEERELVVKGCVAELVWRRMVESEEEFRERSLGEVIRRMREAVGTGADRLKKIEEVLQEMVDDGLVERDTVVVLGKEMLSALS